jgi:hypothetical protein
MNDIRTPPLSERFASIITMMLGMIRAQGLRSLLHLPALWLAAREIRRFGEALGALIAAFEAGTLPPVPPAPAPPTAPLEPLAAPAQSAPPRPRSRRRPARSRPSPPLRRTHARETRARARAMPRPALSMPLPAPLALVRAPDPRKNPFFPICLRTPNLLLYRNNTTHPPPPNPSRPANPLPTLNLLPNHPRPDTKAHA